VAVPGTICGTSRRTTGRCTHTREATDAQGRMATARKCTTRWGTDRPSYLEGVGREPSYITHVNGRCCAQLGNGFMRKYSVHGTKVLLLLTFVVGTTAGVGSATKHHVTTPTLTALRSPSRPFGASVIGTSMMGYIAPSGSLSQGPARRVTIPCSSLELDFSGVRPSVTVAVGSCVNVVVPAWFYGSPTDVTVTPAGILDQRRSTLRTDGSRLTTFSALEPGTATLAAAVTPASALMMPAWSGRVVVRSRGPTGDPVPGQPTHVRATVQNHQVILTWQAPKITPTAGVPTDYLVIWQAPPMLPLTARVDTHSTNISYTSTFGPGTYTVAAKNASGTGLPSKPVTVCENQSSVTSRRCLPT